MCGKTVTFPKHISPGEALAALVNSANPIGLGWFDYDGTRMTHEEATELLSKNSMINYANGRYIRINFATYPTLNSEDYDKENGNGLMSHVAEMLCDRVSIPIPQKKDHGELLDIWRFGDATPMGILPTIS